MGTIRAARGVELSAETSGEIIAITVQSGEQVKAGQAMLTLNDSVEQASRKRQEANLELARLLYERDASLVKKKSIPQSQYDRSQADLDSAIAQLAETDARLDNKRISRPFAGTTGIIKVKVGDYIESGTPITTLQDLSELEIDFSVPDRYFPEPATGTEHRRAHRRFPGSGVPRHPAGAGRQRRHRHPQSAAARHPGRQRRSAAGHVRPPDYRSGPTGTGGHGAGDCRLLLAARRYGLRPDTGQGRDDGAAASGPNGCHPRRQIAILDGLLSGEWVVTVGQNKLYRDARVTVDDSVDL